MNEHGKTKKQLIDELAALRQRLAQLEEVAAEPRGVEGVVRWLEKALETMDLGVTITDVHGRIVYANPAEARRLGYTVDELIGRDVGIYAGRPVRKPLTSQQLNELASWTRESVNVRRDGSVLPVQLKSDVVRSGSGEPVGVVTTSEDITERKRTEEALRRSDANYRALVEHATYAIFQFSVDGRLHATNPALVKMLGYDSETQLQTINLATDVYVDRDAFTRMIAQCQEGERIEGMEVEWKCNDGNRITVRLSGRAVCDEMGELDYVEMIAEDVTEQRALEVQLRQAQKMEALGQLTGGIAHDFNNILTVILANADLVGESLAAERTDQHADVEELKAAAHRGRVMVRKLLGFSRQSMLTLERVELTQVVNELAETLDRLLPESIEVRFVAKDSPLFINADQGAVEQILINLATNARDAMPRDGLLRIETRRAMLDAEHQAAHGWGEPGEYGCLVVSDTGTGMESGILAQIFDPFFTTKPPGEGTGLGMAMIYGLVKDHRGYVDVRSEVGKGTMVEVYFPLSGRPSTSAAPIAEEDEPLRGGGETILIIEDEAAIRRTAKRVLERFGYTVLLAADGEEGLAVFRAHMAHIDLVICDVVMPRLGGADVYKAIRAEAKAMRFMFTSGYTERDFRTSVALSPTMPFLYKPWTVAELVQRVREMLGRGADV